MTPLLDEVRWSPETVEAHLAADVAEIALEDARQALDAVLRGEGNAHSWFEREAAQAYVKRAEERLAEARCRYRALALEDARGVLAELQGENA